MSQDNFYTGCKITRNKFSEKILKKLKNLEEKKEPDFRYITVITEKKLLKNKE